MRKYMVSQIDWMDEVVALVKRIDIDLDEEDEHEGMYREPPQDIADKLVLLGYKVQEEF